MFLIDVSIFLSVKNQVMEMTDFGVGLLERPEVRTRGMALGKRLACEELALWHWWEAPGISAQTPSSMGHLFQSVLSYSQE